MINRKKGIALTLKALGAIAFVCLLALNMKTFVKKDGGFSFLTLQANAQTGEQPGSNCLEFSEYDGTYIEHWNTPCCQVQRKIYTAYKVYYVGQGCPTGIGSRVDLQITYSGTNCCA